MKEDKEQLLIWDDRKKCVQLREYWGDYEAAKKDPLRESFISTVSKLIKMLPTTPVTLLDVGCGTGHNLWAWRRKATLYGLDYSKEMMAFVGRQFKNYDFTRVCGDCWNIPYKDNTFDIVVQMDVCLHIGGSWESIQEMLRVTKRYVVFTGPSFENWEHVMSKRVKGKMSWGVSALLLEKELREKEDKGEIAKHFYVHRPWHGKEKFGRIKHRILVIDKGRVK